MKNQKMLAALFVTVMIMLGPFCCASAQAEVIKLKYATPFSKTHPFTKGDLKWIEKIEKETEGRVKFTVYFGGVLYKSADWWPSMVKGMSDVGLASGAYEKSGMEIMQAARGFVYGINDSKIARKVHAGYLSKFPEAMAQYKALKPLAATYVTPYHVMTAKRPIRKIEDFKGLQIRCLPHHMDVITDVGAAGMSIPISEAYVALQKGTIDGLLAAHEMLKSFRIAEVVKYVTRLDWSTGANMGKFMTWDSWNRLPADIQKLFNDNSEYWYEQIAYEMEAADEDGIKYAKELGVEFIELPKADLEAFYKAMERSARKEAAALDKKGLPGTAIFEEIRSLKAKYME